MGKDKAVKEKSTVEKRRGGTRNDGLVFDPKLTQRTENNVGYLSQYGYVYGSGIRITPGLADVDLKIAPADGGV